MTAITDFANILNGYVGLITVISVVGGGVWALVKFRQNIKDKRFKTYHELLDGLVNEKSAPGGVLKLDRQIAIVYELRNFADYYPVTKRILEGLRKEWPHPRIIGEIELTLGFIEANPIERFWTRLIKNK